WLFYQSIIHLTLHRVTRRKLYAVRSHLSLRSRNCSPRLHQGIFPARSHALRSRVAVRRNDCPGGGPAPQVSDGQTRNRRGTSSANLRHGGITHTLTQKGDGQWIRQPFTNSDVSANSPVAVSPTSSKAPARPPCSSTACRSAATTGAR